MELTQEQIDNLDAVIATIETDEELKALSVMAKQAIVNRKKAGETEHLQTALLKYEEKNELGKRIYSIPEVAKLTGTPVAKLYKALKDQTDVEVAPAPAERNVAQNPDEPVDLSAV